MQFTPSQAQDALERCAVIARDMRADVVRIRPGTFVAILKANPNFIAWERDRAAGGFFPTIKTRDGRKHRAEISENLYARQSKVIEAAPSGRFMVTEDQRATLS